jgi:ribonucleoside-diphosphate reductase alpha chain
MNHTTVRTTVMKFSKSEMTDELQALKNYLSSPVTPVLKEQPETLADILGRLERVEKQLTIPERKRLSDERKGITHHFKIFTRNAAGDGVDEINGYISTGEYEGGRLGEIFIKVGKPGEATAVLDQYATMFSIALQYGASVEELCQKGIGARFEPSGATKNPEIPRCTSPIDYICRLLLKRYGKQPEQVQE